MPRGIITATADRINENHTHHSTMATYVKECRATFDEEPFNEVDSLIFSWLTYLHIPEEILPKCPLYDPETHENSIFTDTDSCLIRDFVRAEYLPEMLTEIWSPEETAELLYALALSPRFEMIRLCFRREELAHKIGKQFSAMTFQIAPGLTYIAFKGTDKTLTGWEENFRLCLKDPVPSQTLAAEYLSSVGEIFRGTLLVGGHSKGGNLAVFASANCLPEVQDRIQLIFTHDGPGFLKEDLEKEGFKRIQPRIRKTAPQFSIFGMLMRQETEPKIIYSYEHGIMQHNATSWKTEGYGFSEYRYPSPVSQTIKNKLNNWIESLTYQEKELFIDTVFNILEETGLDRFGDFKTNTTEILPVVIREFMKLSPSMQGFLFDLLKQLILASDQNIDPNAVLKTESMGETGQYDVTYRPTFARPASADRIKETELKKFEKHPEDIQDLMRKYDSMDF
ncbi:MAG: DUF2974 domain-containing protein [Lachnospiraceae bacterium]|nr:DUF2974 domain-containing protein [Lachnospiraceae bacterium]